MLFKREAERLYLKLEKEIPLIRLCEYSTWKSKEKISEEQFDWNPIYFRKREVYPPLTKEGQIRWKEFLIGNWKSFAIVVFIVLLTLGLIWEYVTNLRTGIECLTRENLLKNLTNYLNP